MRTSICLKGVPCRKNLKMSEKPQQPVRRKTRNDIPGRDLLLGLCLAALIVLPSCALEDNKSGEQLQGVVVILLDTLRADHLSCYGYHRVTDPFISDFSKQGVLFKQVVAPAPWTLPSHVCFFSGNSVSALKNIPGAMPKLQTSLIENFQSAGFKTAGFTEGAYVSKQFGMDVGFDFFYEEQGPIQLLKNGERRNPNYRGGIDHTFRQAEKWLQAHKKEKFFMFVHTYEPHVPYTNGDFVRDFPAGRIRNGVYSLKDMEKVLFSKWVLNVREKEYVKSLYDGDILNCDHHVKEFIMFLQKMGLYGKTLIVITSDHGEELGERYENMFSNHGQSLYDELLLVPLIIYNPIEKHYKKIIDTQVRLIDVIPTILDIFGISHNECEGQSFVPLMEGKKIEDLPALSGAMEFGPERLSVRYKGFKYIEVHEPRKQRIPIVVQPIPTRELYNLQKDPSEKVNIVYTQPQLAHDFREELIRLSNSGNMESVRPSTEKMDPLLKRRLRSLGYVN